MKPDDVFSDAPSLTKMLRVAKEAQPPWEPDELGAILEHQLAAPLIADLESAGLNPEPQVVAACAEAAPPICNFRELFMHPRPPRELLDLTRQFAKHCRSQPECALPAEIATLLYFLAVAVARLRCNCRISGLDDDALRHGLEWASVQPWVDAGSRDLLRQSLSVLG